MAAMERNALLKELSLKLEDQIVHQSSGVFHTLPNTPSAIRAEARRKNHILFERSRILTETSNKNPDK